MVAQWRLASTGENKSDRKANWRRLASWSLTVAQRAVPVLEKSAYGLNSKSLQNSIFHVINHKWASFKLTHMVIHIKTPLDSQICTISYHKVRIYTFIQKLIKLKKLSSNIYKFPFFPLNSYIHHGISSLNILGTTISTFFKKISHPQKRKWVEKV